MSPDLSPAATPVSLVVPVFNERRGLPPLLARLEALLGALPTGSEVLLVDDGSTDGTAVVLERAKLPDAVRVSRHRRNRGYGAAIKTGMRAAQHDLIAITDADGTYPVERLPEMLELMHREDAAMVVGERPVADQPVLRRPAKAALRALAQYLTGQPIPDLNSGLRLFHRPDAMRHAGLLPDGFSFTTTITMALLTEGHHVVYFPIRYRQRIGSSKIRPIRDTATFAMLICRTTLAFNPMKVFGPVGLGLTLLGVVLLVMRMVVGESFGVATTVALLLGGMQVLAMGLLADLVNRRR